MITKTIFSRSIMKKNTFLFRVLVFIGGEDNNDFIKET